MGTIVFEKAPTIVASHGLPSTPIGVGTEYTRIHLSAENKRWGYKQVPAALERIKRAVEVAGIPQESVVTSVARNTRSFMTAIFGQGPCGPTFVEWCPTSRVENGLRAWTFRHRWQEGGGDRWIGKPRYHDDVMGGAWIHEAQLQLWSNELFKHPLGQLIEPLNPYTTTVPAPEGWDETAMSLGAEDLGYAHDDDGLVVHRWQLEWQKQLWTIEVAHPELWQVWEYSIYLNGYYLPCVAAANGRERRNFIVPFVSAIADREWLGDDPERRRAESVFVTELPQLPIYKEPIFVQGEWTVFWPSREAWAAFAREHHIDAHLAWTTSPFKEGPMSALPREWAEKAWASGATPLPRNMMGEIPPMSEWKYRAYGETLDAWGNSVHNRGNWEGWHFRTPTLRGYAAKGLDGELGIYFRLGDTSGGWVKVPSTVMVPVYGVPTIREPGTKPGPGETCVFTDGRIHMRR